MAKKTDQKTIWAGGFETENTGGVLSGFLAEEEEFDRRKLWRLGSWGVASVGAVVLAMLANQSSVGWRRDQVAAADLTRQAQQIQSVARDSHSEAKRLASAIETLNSDRDRLYSRVTVLEQGLDSATGAIARQAAAPAAAAPAGSRLAGGRDAQRCRQARPRLSRRWRQRPRQPPRSRQGRRGTTVAAAAGSSHGLIDRTGTTKSAGSEPGHAADGGAIDDGAAGCGGRQTDRTGGAGEDRHVGTDPGNRCGVGVDAEAEAIAPKLQRTEFGVDVGGANSVGGLRALWRGLLKSKSNAPLSALRPIIVVKEGTGGLGMQLRLVAGPLRRCGGGSENLRHADRKPAALRDHRVRRPAPFPAGRRAAAPPSSRRPRKRAAPSRTGGGRGAGQEAGNPHAVILFKSRAINPAITMA